jgi:serine/threonine protein phosphatase 1
MGEPRLLVIGDVHGAISHLRRLLRRVKPEAGDTLLFLGDYVDRGEDSHAVLDALMDLDKRHTCIFLMGNHEDMLLRACDGSILEFDQWLTNGGRKTFADFQNALPSGKYIQWMRRLRLFHETAEHYFVHAGLRPGVPPRESSDLERLWMREPFLSSTYDWGRRVVFGHTMHFGGPVVQPNKIGIDTGAFVPGFGRLTCLVLPEGQFVFSRGRSRKLT